jgi:hypothetical protein
MKRTTDDDEEAGSPACAGYTTGDGLRYIGKGLALGAAPCSAKFSEWCKVRGVWPRITHEEIWHTAWNAAIEAALLKTPGGSICDPQEVADEIRALMSPNVEVSDRAGDGARS